LGILEDRKDGLKVYYSLRIRCLPSMLSCIEKVVEGKNPETVFLMECCGK
jgi:ArsR family transcriptional regulator